MAEPLSIEVTAEIREFERRLALLPGIGEQQAKQLATVIRKQMQNAEQGFGKSTSNMTHEIDKVISLAERGFRRIGGAVADVHDTITQIAKPVAEVGLAFGGVGAAVGLLAAAAITASAGVFALVGTVQGVTTAAVQAEQELTRMGRAAAIPASATMALAEYTAATTELRVAWNLLRVELGAETAPILTGLVVQLTEVVEWVSALDITIRGTAQNLDTFGNAIAAIGASSPLVSFFGSTVSWLADGVSYLAGEGESAVEVWEDYSKALEENHAWMEKVRAGIRAYDLEQQAALRTTEEIAAAERERARLLLGVWDELEIERAIDLRRMSDLTQMFLDEDVQAIVDNQVKQVQAVEDAERKKIHSWRVAATVANDLASGFTAITDLVVDNMKRREAAGESLGAAEIANANRLFRLSQIAQLGAMAVNAISTYFSLTRDFAAIPGNAAAAPFQAAAIVSASMIAPAVQVLGQQVPFPYGSGGGGPPNIATHAEDPIAQGTIDAANSGQKAGGNIEDKGGQIGRTSNVVVTLDRRTSSLRIVGNPVGKSSRGAT